MTDRIRELAFEIADSAARRDIEVYCAWTSEVPAERWFDTQLMDEAANDLNVRPVVDVAVEYLDLRGLLQRCADRANWVRVKAEGM